MNYIGCRACVAVVFLSLFFNNTAAAADKTKKNKKNEELN